MKTFPLLGSGIAMLLLTLTMLLPQKLSATHAMGSDLTYQCVGPNTYLVTLTLYRDCNGIPTANTQNVTYTSASCGVSSGITLLPVDSVEITPVCPGIVGSACTGNGIYGIQRWTYQATLTLPAGCDDWVLGWRKCCRNGAITSLANPLSEQMYIEAEINDLASPCNNSPIFLNEPTVFSCVGQQVHYNHGANDPDGDSLAFSLTQCYDGANNPVVYNAGFSAVSPLVTSGGVSVDAATGAITFTPSIAQVGVLCVLVEEFRNGVKIGEVVRDMQFTVLACNNNSPALSGIDGTNDFTATVQAGSQLCFDLFSSDPDAGQTTGVYWDNAIGGATFTAAGSPFATGTFCWTPTAADVGTHTFTVTVHDDYCPLVGINTYTYVINVTPPPATNCDSVMVNLISYNDAVCAPNDGSAILSASGGTAPYTYQVINWTTGEVFTNTTGVFDNLTAGIYNVWVTDANGCTPSCAGATFEIESVGAPLSGNVTAVDANCPSNSFSPYDSTANTGSVHASASGGTGPYMYSLNGGAFQASGDFFFLPPGTYNLTILDANGCVVSETVTVGEPDPLQLTVISMTPPTCGQSNGSITLQASGGDGIYAYYINGQMQGSGTFTGLAAGTYTFAVCDGSYCVYDTTITIPDGPGIAVNVTSTDPSCAGDCDGTATASTMATTGGVTYAWSTGDNSATISGLCAGTYTVTATNANGCESVGTVTINDPAPVDLAIAATSDETCAGNDGTATLAVTGGTAPYTYNIANMTNPNSYSNGTGAFSGLEEGTFLAQVVDANGCTNDCVKNFTLGGCRRSSGGNTTILGALGMSGPSLMINPNPANMIAQISFVAPETTGNSITILASDGRTLYSKVGLSQEALIEVNINNWAGGNYVVLLRDAEGKVLKSKRLVVDK